MDDMQTMVRAEIVIDGMSSLLAQDQDVADLRRRIEDATATSGRFVDFVVVGNRDVSVLVTSTSRVMISVATVQFDSRDTGDTEFPYGGHFDMLCPPYVSPQLRWVTAKAAGVRWWEYHRAIILVAPLGTGSRGETEEPIMGKFIYEGGPKVEIEDRALSHLQLAVTAKLRRGEPFSFTWKEDTSIGAAAPRCGSTPAARSSSSTTAAGSQPSTANGSKRSRSPRTHPAAST